MRDENHKSSQTRMIRIRNPDVLSHEVNTSIILTMDGLSSSLPHKTSDTVDAALDLSLLFTSSPIHARQQYRNNEPLHFYQEKSHFLFSIMGEVSSSLNSGNGTTGCKTWSKQLQRYVWHPIYVTRPRTTSCDAGPPPSSTPVEPPLPPPLPPTAGSSSSSPPPPPPPSSTSSEEADRITAAAEAVAPVPNPGSYESASVDIRRILTPDTYDGFRCDITKQLNPFMAIVHNFWLGTTMIPDGRSHSYAVSAQVANEQAFLYARVDPYRRSVDGRVHLGLPIPIRMQLAVGADGQNDQLLVEADYGSETWMANLKYGSMGDGLVWGCNYFQAITRQLAMGGEGLYISANNNLLSSYTIKYTIPARTGEEDSVFQPVIPGSTSSRTSGTLKGSSTICANLNLGQSLLTLSYLRLVTPNRVTLAAELQCNPMTFDSQVMLGAEFKLLRNRFSAVIDGTGKVQSTLEAKLDKKPGSPSLIFSAELDHAKEVTRFGYGISFD